MGSQAAWDWAAWDLSPHNSAGSTSSFPVSLRGPPISKMGAGGTLLWEQEYGCHGNIGRFG